VSVEIIEGLIFQLACETESLVPVGAPESAYRDILASLFEQEGYTTHCEVTIKQTIAVRDVTIPVILGRIDLVAADVPIEIKVLDRAEVYRSLSDPDHQAPIGSGQLVRYMRWAAFPTGILVHFYREKSSPRVLLARLDVAPDWWGRAR
jgi:hypothetical protein